MSWPVALSTELTEDAELDWRRPHPITIVVEIGNALRSVVIALVAAIGLVVALVPPGYRHGARLLLEPWLDPLQASPFRVTVSPGDERIAAGRDQLFVARAVGFEAEAAVLVTRRSAGEPWQRTPMVPVAEGGGFETYLLDIDEPLEYYVEADRVRSQRHRIEVVTRHR